MSRPHSLGLFFLLAAAAACALPGRAPAQVPPGFVVACSFDANGTLPITGDGGLFLLHPRTPGMPIPVGGLSPELTGTGVTVSQGYGANAIAALPDGDLLVGDVALPGESLDIHRIRLRRTGSGWVGDLVRKYAIGTATGLAASVDDIEVLPGNLALFAADSNVTGPMRGFRLGTVELGSGALTPIPISGPRNVNALAVSADARTYYLGEFATFSGRVFRVPATGGAAAPVNPLPFPGGVMALDRDNDGNLAVGSFGSTGSAPFGTPPNLHVLEVATGRWTNLANARVVRNGVLVERNTGTIVTGGVNQSISLVDPVTGRETQLGTFVSGVMSGLAQRPAIAAFGSQSGGAAAYRWQTAPNPGGLPLLDTQAFFLTLDTAARPLVGIAAFSFGRSRIPNLPAPGATLLLDPATMVWWNLITGAPPFRVALPIPNRREFVGRDAFGQTFHLDRSGSTSSPGIRITVL